LEVQPQAQLLQQQQVRQGVGVREQQHTLLQAPAAGLLCWLLPGPT
jgi:hypothetical protein